MKDRVITDDLIEFVWACDPGTFRLADGTVCNVVHGDSIWGQETDSGIVLHFHTKGKH